MPVTVRTKRLPKLTYVDDVGYIQGRLQDTFIFNSKGKMVYVRNVERGPLIYWYDHKTEDVEPISYVDLSPFKYGYANVAGATTYITRMPLRNDWRQGNRLNQLVFRGHYRLNKDSLDEGMWDLQDTVENRFYSYQTCLDMIEDGYVSRSINRDFALDKDYTFFYRGLEVGTISPDNGRVFLLPEYHWLQESVNEMDDVKEIKQHEV